MDELAWRIARTVYPLLAGVAVIGIVLNTLLMLTTIVTKSLRSTANILIGCCALFDIMHEFGYFIQFPIMFTDYLIDSYYCSCMQLIPAIGRASGAFCVLSIGIDRMLCLIFPLAYKRTSKLYFLVCHLLSIALFSSWTVYLMIAYWTHQKQICSMPAPFHGASQRLWSNTITGVNILSALQYFITWQVVKRRAVSKHKKKIFKSIAVVMVVEVTGWFISSLLIDISELCIDMPDSRPPFHYVACLFVNSGIAVKCIVYYSICADYRQAIRAFLGLPETKNVAYAAVNGTVEIADTQAERSLNEIMDFRLAHLMDRESSKTRHPNRENEELEVAVFLIVCFLVVGAAVATVFFMVKDDPVETRLRVIRHPFPSTGRKKRAMWRVELPLMQQTDQDFIINMPEDIVSHSEGLSSIHYRSLVYFREVKMPIYLPITPPPDVPSLLELAFFLVILVIFIVILLWCSGCMEKKKPVVIGRSLYFAGWTFDLEKLRRENGREEPMNDIVKLCEMTVIMEEE